MNHDRPRPSSRRLQGNAISALGYATVFESADVRGAELKQQAELIARHCDQRGLELREVVSEREDPKRKLLSRPGFEYVLGQLTSGQAHALVVTELSRLTRSAVDLGTVIDRFMAADARLIAIAEDLDTADEGGRRAAELLVQVSNWERERLSERTRNGLAAARQKRRSTGRPSVKDFPALTRRIARLRAEGMTLQAIADQLNEEGVPTVRGGAKWRHSSVQAAAGYRRRTPDALGSVIRSDVDACKNP